MNFQKNIPPALNKSYFCIVNIENIQLAAVISSYVCKLGEYTPVFEFPTVTISKPEEGQIGIDENYLSVSRANELATRLNNILALQGGTDYLILGGLSDDQKSYLYFSKHYNVIEIDDINDVDFLLGSFCVKNSVTICNEQDVLNGLYTAIKTASTLKIDNSVDFLPKFKSRGGGLIVIESDDHINSVIAINYTTSVDFDFVEIAKPKLNEKEIRFLIENWRNVDENRFYDELRAHIYASISEIEFINFKLCTFFTFGVPYSLVIENCIPVTYVNSQLKPDFFIYTNLFISDREKIASAVVFSPLEFLSEETEFIIHKLKEHKYFVKTLVGKNATAYSIDMHVKEYPFEILHFCSHGGEVDGFTIVQEIKDSDGAPHIIEYDEVVSFAPDRSEDQIQITRKNIFRKMDGLDWGTKELKDKYPSYVFADVIDGIMGLKNDLKRTKKTNIIDSCAIICSDFHYQAMFNRLSGDFNYPFIFNNTCWSWSCISESFLSNGSIGYIGTLWDIENKTAKLVAEEFYSNLFDQSVLGALQIALEKTKGTPDENIYIYWGLHFTSLKEGESIQKSKLEIANRLLGAYYYWNRHMKTLIDKRTIQSIKRIIKWSFLQLQNNFPFESISLIMSQKTKKTWK